MFKLVGFGNKDPEVASTIAGRLARLDKRLTRDDRETLTSPLLRLLHLARLSGSIADGLDHVRTFAGEVLTCMKESYKPPDRVAVEFGLALSAKARSPS